MTQTNQRLIPYKGEKRTLPDWARHLGVPFCTMQQRYRAGVRLDELFNKENYSEGTYPSGRDDDSHRR